MSEVQSLLDIDCTATSLTLKIVNLQQFQILGSAINMESFEIFASHFIGRLNPRISLVFNFSRDVVKVK